MNDTDYHLISFYTCNNIEKLCDNNKIVSFQWKNFLKQLISIHKQKLKYRVLYSDNNITICDDNNNKFIFNTPIIISLENNDTRIIGYDENNNYINILYTQDLIECPDFINLVSNKRIDMIKGFNLCICETDSTEVKIKNLYYYERNITHHYTDKYYHYYFIKFLYDNELLKYNLPDYFNEPYIFNYIIYDNALIEMILDSYIGTDPCNDLQLDYTDAYDENILMQAIRVKNNNIINKLLQLKTFDLFTKNSSNKTVFDIIMMLPYTQNNKRIIKNIISNIPKIDSNDLIKLQIIYNLIENIIQITEESFRINLLGIIMSKLERPLNYDFYFNLLQLIIDNDSMEIFDIISNEINYHDRDAHIRYLNQYKSHNNFDKYLNLITKYLNFTQQEIHQISIEENKNIVHT